MRHLVGKRAFLIGLFALLAVAPFIGNQYHTFIANLILLYIILSLGLNLLIGYAGQLALSNAAMYGIGAYGTGLLMKHFGLPYWISAPGGVLLAMALGTLLALPALRMSGIYLALTTLAFAQFTFWVMTHWTDVTFGAGGFVPPPLDFSPLPVSQETGVYYLSWIAAALLYVVAKHTMESPIGRAFVAIRDREVAAESLGIDLFKYKALAFAMSGFYAGVAGALYSGLARLCRAGELRPAADGVAQGRRRARRHGIGRRIRHRRHAAHRARRVHQGDEVLHRDRVRGLAHRLRAVPAQWRGRVREEAAARLGRVVALRAAARTARA